MQMLIYDTVMRNFDLRYGRFARWLDRELSRPMPVGVVAYCINIYDDDRRRWSIELVGCASFDEHNSDWACDELYATRQNALCWRGDVHWRNVLEQVSSFLSRYQREGRRATVLNAVEGVGVGFIDGNLIITRNRTL